VALGVVLAGVVWASGLGIVAALRGGRDQYVFAYPVGLALVLAAAAFELYRPWLGIVSVAILGWPMFLLVRHREVAANVWRVSRRPLAWGGPSALALAVSLGAYFHGPGPSYDSGAGGDIVFYAGRIAAVRHSLFPFTDLAVAGRHFTYAEVGPSAIGAVVSHFPAFDPFLFGAVTLPLASMLSVLVGIALVGRPQRDVRGADVVLVTMLAFAMVLYASTLVESSPVTLSLPLAFAMWALYREPRSLWSLIAWSALLGTLCLCTKVLVLIPLGVLFCAVLLRDHRQHLSRKESLFLGVGAALVCAAVVGTLFASASWFSNLFDLRFGTVNDIRGLRQVTRTQYAPAGVILNDLGIALLCVGLIRERRHAIALAVALPILTSQFLGGINVHVATATAVLIAAIDLWARPANLEWFGWFGAAGLFLCAAVVVRDVVPLRTAMVFDLLLAATIAAGFIATLPSSRLLRLAIAALGPALVFALAGRGVLAFVAPFSLLVFLTGVRAGRATIRVVSIAGAGLVLVAVLGATAVAVERDNFRIRARSTVPGAQPLLSRDDWDAWHFVKASTEPRALIFTSLTGRTVDEHHGWNYYAMLGARQVYIAGWVDNDLSVNERVLVAMLDANSNVLAGKRRSCVVANAKSYTAYYAVMQRGEDPPPRAKLLHENPSLAIYLLPHCSAAA
jgi:hypothetical protein